MTAAASDDNTDEFTTPHLPERYHQTVRAKKQRRLKKQILMAGCIILIIVVLYFLLNWAAGGVISGVSLLSYGQSPAGTGTVTPSNTANVTPAFTQGTGLTTGLAPGVLPLDSAVTAVVSHYPAAEFTIRSANLTSYSGRFLYEFGIQPAAGDSQVIPVFIDARSGKVYSPGEDEAKVSRDGAQERALGAFSSLNPDRSVLTFSGNADEGNTWEFVLFRNGAKVATGILDAYTGELVARAKIIAPEGRPAQPAIDAAKARSIADRYIIDHNGGQLPLNMSVYRYEPVTTSSGTVAGQYVFIFERTFQDFPTDVDGFTVAVDAVTGEVTGYTQQWTTPEHAFSAAMEPDVIKREATFEVMQKAKETYPNNIAGLRIISADIRWKNRVPYGTIPRPGTIPLAWKVVFDDDFIRGNASASSGVAWVDVKTGDFLGFDYRH